MAKSRRYWWEVSVIALIMLLVEISKKAFPPKQLASSGLYMGFKLWGKKKQQQQQKQGQQISNFMVVWTTETMRLSHRVKTLQWHVDILTRKNNVHSNYSSIIRQTVDMVYRISIKGVAQCN